MKKLLFSLVGTVLFGGFCIGQSNNPFDKKGKDYVASLLILKKDYKEGKIKNADQATLDYYAKKLPLVSTPSTALAAKVIKATTTQSVVEVINGSTLSSFSKDVLQKSIAPKADIVSLVENVKKRSLPAAESELVLTSLSMTYNIGQTEELRYGDCNVFGYIGTGACAATGGLIGTIIGDIICGPLCGFAGALIGGFLGALKD